MPVDTVEISDPRPIGREDNTKEDKPPMPKPKPPKMPKPPSASALRREIASAQRGAQRQNERTMRKVNQDLERRLKRVTNEANRDAERRARRLASRPVPVGFTPAEQGLAERVYEAVSAQDDRDYDVFLSYAHSDGTATAIELNNALVALGVEVWFDETKVVLGKSLALQMDRGLRLAHAGVILLTPAFLEGRFWPQREQGVLLGKPTVIPVLHRVSFGDVARYSGMLPDMIGLSTDNDTIEVLAEKIAVAVLGEDAA